MEYKQHVLVAERVLENDLAFLAWLVFVFDLRDFSRFRFSKSI